MNNSYNGSLEEFIEQEKTFFNSLETGINWNKNKWDVTKWIPHRGTDQNIIFTTLSISQSKKGDMKDIFPPKDVLPQPYNDFVKALSVYLYRTKKCGYMAGRN